MLIVLDCPGCAKRYEIDAALAGKKSRCKQCGEVFKIPVPRAIPSAFAPEQAIPTDADADADRRRRVEYGSGGTAADGQPEAEIDSARLGPESHHSELSPLPEAVRVRRRTGRQEIALQGLRRVLLDSRAEGTCR